MEQAIFASICSSAQRPFFIRRPPPRNGLCLTLDGLSGAQVRELPRWDGPVLWTPLRCALSPTIKIVQDRALRRRRAARVAQNIEHLVTMRTFGLPHEHLPV